MLSIVGDGRYLLYSLLQVGHAMLPTWWEAEDLRQQLRAHLNTTYTDRAWSARVPPQLSENLSVSAFAERFLTLPTVRLLPDAICLWQDTIAATTVAAIEIGSNACRRRAHQRWLWCCCSRGRAASVTTSW